MSDNTTTIKPTEVKEVLSVIVFLDLFSYPLTSYELWCFLDKNYNFNFLLKILDDLVKQNILAQAEGFYFLKDREELITIRRQRHNYTLVKLKKARKFAYIFSLFPGVQAVAAANLIGGYNWRLVSDIDLFIITKNNQLWLSRLFCAGITKILAVRPTMNNKQDKICLSFYLSKSALDTKNLSLKPEDPYFKFWLHGLIPLKDKEVWLEFSQLNNLRSDYTTTSNLSKKYKTKIREAEKEQKRVVARLINNLEQRAKKFQLRIMPLKLKEQANQEIGVILRDDLLKLFLEDKRLEFLYKSKKKIHEILAKIY